MKQILIRNYKQKAYSSITHRGTQTWSSCSRGLNLRDWLGWPISKLLNLQGKQKDPDYPTLTLYIHKWTVICFATTSLIKYLHGKLKQ